MQRIEIVLRKELTENQIDSLQQAIVRLLASHETDYGVFWESCNVKIPMANAKLYWEK